MGVVTPRPRFGNRIVTDRPHFRRPRLVRWHYEQTRLSALPDGTKREGPDVSERVEQAGTRAGRVAPAVVRRVLFGAAQVALFLLGVALEFVVVWTLAT